MRPLLHIAGACVFVVLATLNAGGYRYGAADQAFYIPAILKQLDPARFPRDTALIGPQARYFFVDEIVATAVHLTGWSIEVWFAMGYVATLVLLYTGLWRLGHVVFQNQYATAALILAATLRHRITKTGVNTLEGYFHPRMLVFALGVWAIVAYLRGRPLAAMSLLLVGGLLHPTTAAFFVLFLAAAIWVSEPAWRRPVGIAATVGVAAAGWMLLAGPLSDGTTPMDPEWRALLASKDYLFPVQDWRATTWLVNLGTAALAIGTLAHRVVNGLARPREAGLLAGAIVLLTGFLITLPAVSAGWAFFVQLQISRVFWPLELLAIVAVVWWITEGSPSMAAETRRRRAQVLLWLLLAFSVVRSGWVALVEHRDRPMVTLTLPADDWTRVMAWAQSQPAGVHVLADPGHAWRFGTPLRYGGQDVFLEEVKDTAMAIYSRASAARVLERQSALGDFARLDEAAAGALAQRYRLDYLVIDRDLALHEAARFGPFRVYRLRN